MIIPVILAGGSGTRLWPFSRELYPKQLLPLVDNGTMLQNTLPRLSGLAGTADPIVICNEDHRFPASRVLQEMERVAPEIVQSCKKALNEGISDLDFFRLESEAFQSCPTDSIDYAVMGC